MFGGKELKKYLISIHYLLFQQVASLFSSLKQHSHYFTVSMYEDFGHNLPRYPDL
jgi:hypothetical protein